MGLFFSIESYNGLNTIYANNGDRQDGEVTFTTLFQIGSGTANTCTYGSTATQAWLTFQNASFADRGFLDGDSITITFTPTATGVPETYSRTINYVSGNTIYLNSGLPGYASGTVFPTDGAYSGISIVADKRPNSIEFQFNLTPNGSTSYGSVIDTELTRFELQDTDTITQGVPYAMTQLGNASGSVVTDVFLTYTGDALNGNRDFKVTYKTLNWGFLKDGYTMDNPPYYDGADCLAPIVRMKAFAQYGNPNGVLINNTVNNEANTGGFDENYNGGNSLYTVLSTSWVDSLGATIDTLDYSGTSTFTAVVSAPGQVDPQSTYRLGLIWRPIDGTYYKNRLPSLANNLLLNTPDNDFIADGVTDATVYAGNAYVGSPIPNPNNLVTDGAKWDIKDVNISISGVDEITIVGTVVPNTQANTLFVDVPDGGRKSTLWLSIGDYTNDGQFNSTRVSLKLWDEDNYDAPTIGVQIPDVVDENLYDHDSNDIDTPLPQTTTEDDVLYISNFKLLDGLNYEGIRTRIFAYNTVTEDEFTLEDNFFSFTNVPFVSGIFEVNELQNRNFNLPPTTDRNHISLVRNNALDGGGKYGVTLEYGFLNDWRYWLEESDANLDFFDYTVPDEQNGLNKDWQHYSNSGNWIIRVAYYTRLAGVDDFNYYEMGIRPYEDDANVSATTTYEVLSDGTTPLALVADELIEVETVFTWTGLFTNEWVEFTCEDYEAGNRWVMSSVLAQGNISSNPLKPIAGQTLIDVTGTGTNTLTCKANIDTSLIDVNKVSLSFRVYSDGTGFDYLLNVFKEGYAGYSLRKLSPNAIYPDSSPCMKVRRDTDNLELDIPFDGTYIDEVELIRHVTNAGANPTANGYVTKWYDQGGNNNHAIQTTAANQPLIVSSGVINTDDDGNSAVSFNGAYWMWYSVPSSNTLAAVSIATVADAGTVVGTSTRPVGFAEDPAAAPVLVSFTQAQDNTLRYGGGASSVGTVPIPSSGVYLRTSFKTNAAQTDYIDTALSINDTVVMNNTSKTVMLGTASVPAITLFDGNITECVFYDSDQSANRTTIESNINNYYGL